MGCIWQLYMNRRNNTTISVATWLSTDVWDDIVKGHYKHTRSVKGDVIYDDSFNNNVIQFNLRGSHRNERVTQVGNQLK